MLKKKKFKLDYRQKKRKSLLLVLDRREDPLTPLLTQWTYQAMTHELLTITNSRIDLKQSHNLEMREIVLNSFDDKFYEKNQMLNFGDLGAAIKNLVEEYQKKKYEASRIINIDDIRCFVDNYEEYMEESNSVSKHVGLLTELSNLIRKRKLLKISRLEQDIVCNENFETQFESLEMILKNPHLEDFDKLKLVLIFSLRYEKYKNNKISRLQNLLLKTARSDEARKKVEFVNLIIEVCGQDVRQNDLFRNQNIIYKVDNMLKGLKGVENIYMQHSTFLEKIINAVLENNLNLIDYPLLNGSLNGGIPSEIIIFIIGGVTYEEAALIRNKQSKHCNFLLGGSCIHNSESFLKDLSYSSLSYQEII